MKKEAIIEPPYNSPFIEKRLSEIRYRKDKNAFLETIMTDSSASVLHEINGHRTILFPRNKGPKTITWEQTKQMAIELNSQGYDVAFLPELTFETSADSLIKKGNNYMIADFKFCATTKTNTLVKDLEHGFKQAKTIVLKLETMDSGTFHQALEYTLRNKIPYGDIILMNKYGKVRIISHKEIRNYSYVRKTKGFL